MTVDALLTPRSLAPAVRAAAQSHDRGTPASNDAMTWDFPQTTDNVERLQAMLDYIQPAIEGAEIDYPTWRDRVLFPLASLAAQGWEADQLHTIAVESSRHYPGHRDREFNILWRSAKPTGRRTTRGIASLIGFCRDRGYREALDLSADPELADAPSDKPPKFVIEHASTFATVEPIAYLIDGLIPAQAIVLLIGQSGAGKSFVAIDLAGSIARGVAWRGRRTAQGRVIIVAAEGAEGMRRRIAAYGVAHAVDLADMPVGVIATPPNLMGDNDLGELARSVVAFGGADLIVIDTLAAVTPGGDENSAESMGAVIARCGRLRRATGATVLLVHHLGKDASKGARGWSGLHAAADAVLEVVRDGDQRRMRTSKMKDGIDGGELGFTLRTVEIGVPDADGGIATSCVVEHIDSMPTGKPRRPTGAVQLAIYRVIEQHGPIAVADAINLAVPLLAYDAGADRRDRRREHLRRAIDALTAVGLIRLVDGRLSTDSWPDGGDGDGL